MLNFRNIDYKTREKYFFFVFLLSLFIFYILWALVIPFDNAPDEKMRYQIPMFIYQNGCLPAGGDPSIRDVNWGISYAFTPITSYIVSALFMKITSFFTTAPDALLLSARLVSTVCATLTVAICYPISQRLFKDKIYLRWIFIVFVSLLPEFCFISAYVNIDAFAILSTAVIVYAWIIGLESNWNYKSCIVLAAGLSMCLLSYYNAYGFIVCSIMIFFATILSSYARQENSTADVLKKTGVVVGIVLLLTSWWFIRNGILYNGDILGFSTSNQYGEMYAVDGFKPSQRLSAMNRGQSLTYMLFGRWWLFYTLLSFIGWFGNFTIPLLFRMYLIYVILFGLGIIGCFVGFRKFFPKVKDKITKNIKWFNLTMLIAAIFPFFIDMVYSYCCDYQAQGRYALPAVIPLMFLLTAGLGVLMDKLLKDKEKVKKIISIVICCTYIFLGLYSFFGVLCPAYH